MTKTSIIIPVIRPEKAERCLRAIEANAGVPRDSYETVISQDHDHVGCPAMVAKLTGKAGHNRVMFLGDDTIPQPGFLAAANEAMDSLPDGWGVVGLNTTGDNRVAHWLADKRMLTLIPGGEFFSTDYKHCWCDNELMEIAQEHGRWAFAEGAAIEHKHPIFNTAEWDPGYAEAYSDHAKRWDLTTYWKRKRERMATRFGHKPALALPLTRELVYTNFLFSWTRLLTTYMMDTVRAGRGINLDFITPYFPGQIDAIRNDLVRQALFTGCTHILMLDTDQIYITPDLIKRLLDHDRPVVGGMVHRRYPPFDPLLLRGDVNRLESVPPDEVDAGGLVPVDATGCGCIMYDTRVFIDIPEPWFEMTTGEFGQPVGEDIGFCAKLQQMGIEIVVDCDLEIQHLSLLAVDKGTHRLYTKLTKHYDRRV